MSEQDAINILHKHESVFKLLEDNQTVEDPSSLTMGEILGAYKVFNPGFVLDSCCSSCVFSFMKRANEIRKSNPKHYSFPKQ